MLLMSLAIAPASARASTFTESVLYSFCSQGAANCTDGSLPFASMVLAHDASCFIDWFDEDIKSAAMPNWHYLHISNDVLPALRERGVTQEQLDQMLVDNPRAIFNVQGGYGP